MSLFSELRRRNVFKVAVVYLVGAPLLFWLALIAEAQLGLPDWFNYIALALLILAFPGVLMFAWVYEITPSGLRKAIEVDQTQSIVFKTGQKLNAALAVLTVLAAVAMIADRLLPELARPDLTPLDEIRRDLIVDPDAASRLVTPSGERTPTEIRSFTLENGLEVIVWPDHDIPNVAMYLFVRAGSRNEVPGITGLSHFFEHMMFNGSENVPSGEFDKIMSAAGGANNAYTSPDLTVYQDWFPSSALHTVFALEADRFGNLAIDPEAVESERGVVYSERRTRIDNDSFGSLYEKLVATAWVAHTYQLPVIGWPSDIEAWTQDDLENYFRTYYAPNNMVMVIAGDIEAEHAYNLVRTYFGDIPSQPAPAEVRTVEPPQQGQRRLTVSLPGQAPLLHFGFHSVKATDPDALAIELLTNILVNGNSSRLHRALVEEASLALSVGSFAYGEIDPGLFYLYLTLPVGADVAAVEARVMEVLADVVDNGVTEEELAKARNIMLADYWRRVSMIDGKAALVGEAAVLQGNYETLFDLPDQVDALTVDALKQAAARVFRAENSTVGVFLPAVASDGGDE